MNRIIIVLLLFVALAYGQDVPAEITLDQCVELALKANISILQNRLTIRQSEISVSSAKSGLLPSANISSSASSAKTDLPGMSWESDWRMSGSVNQNIYQPGLYSGIRLAKMNEATTRLNADEVKTQIISSVHRLYYQILTSQALIGVYKENILSAEQNLEKIRYMFQVGAKTESDVLKAEVQLGDIQASLLSEEENLLALKRDMDILLGHAPSGQFSLAPIPVDKIELPEWSVAREMLLQRNQGYQAQLSSLKAQKLSVRISREAYLPSLSGSYSYSKSGDFDGNTGPAGHSVSLRASMDLFDGFRKHQNVQREQLDLEKLTLDLEEKERQLTQDLASVFQNIATLNQLIQLREKTVRSAQRDLQLVSERYAMGGSTILDQTSAQAALIKSQTELVRVQYSRKIAEAQVKQLLNI